MKGKKSVQQDKFRLWKRSAYNKLQKQNSHRFAKLNMWIPPLYLLKNSLITSCVY